MPRKTNFAYLGRDRDGAAVGMIRDNNDETTAKGVSQLITGGLLVQRLPIDQARQAYSAGGGRAG